MAVAAGLGFSALALGALGADAWRPWSRVLRGHYAFGFETSDFQPCGSSDWWHAAGDLGLAAAFADTAAAFAPTPHDPPWMRRGRVYLVARGRVSLRGRYGHLGLYDRAFRVDSVLEVRLPGAGDCRR